MFVDLIFETILIMFMTKILPEKYIYLVIIKGNSYEYSYSDNNYS